MSDTDLCVRHLTRLSYDGGMDLLLSAKAYATLHHVIRKGQLYGVVAYTHHLDQAERVLLRFGERRPVMRAAIWLHDLVEDTDVKLRDIEENFGDDVAALVGAVTSEPGPDRRTRNALTYPKIRHAGPDAVRLKLADRIANVENGGGSLSMYVREHPDFRHALFSPADSLNPPMWDELDRLISEAT